MLKNIILYAHSGSSNHGCEAIVRGTHKIINNISTLYSLNPAEDQYYKINKLINVEAVNHIYPKYHYKRILASLLIHITKNRRYSERIPFDHLFKKYGKNDIAISIGGDNYCYTSYEVYEILNENFNKKGTKTVLWGCSIEPQIIDQEMAKDLQKYSLITARESISYEAIKKVNKNTKLYPDPAFLLDKVNLPLPNEFLQDSTIGINISPMIISYEKVKGQTMAGYTALIKHIIKTTHFNIALIPHVIWESNDDRKPLKELFNAFKNTGRVFLIEDHNCMELKGFISQLRMFIGARTHATIAAYSTCVPTLVVGYSVKAKGIAKDLFGTYDNYVVPVQTIEKEKDLINAFEWLKNNENKIKTHLTNIMPAYCAKAMEAGKEIDKIISNI